MADENLIPNEGVTRIDAVAAERYRDDLSGAGRSREKKGSLSYLVGCTLYEDYQVALAGMGFLSMVEPLLALRI